MSVTRDYALELDREPAPLLSVFGGKITTYRKLAEDAVNLLRRHARHARAAVDRGRDAARRGSARGQPSRCSCARSSGATRGCPRRCAAATRTPTARASRRVLGTATGTRGPRRRGPATALRARTRVSVPRRIRAHGAGYPVAPFQARPASAAACDTAPLERWLQRYTAAVAQAAWRGSSESCRGSRRHPRRLTVLTLVALAPLWLVGIFGRALWTPDEPREADIAWRMSQQSDRTLPHLGGTPFLEKPPLTYWLSAATVSVLGGFTGCGAGTEPRCTHSSPPLRSARWRWRWASTS